MELSISLDVYKWWKSGNSEFQKRIKCEWASNGLELHEIQKQMIMYVVVLYFKSTVLHLLTELSSTFNIVFQIVFTLPGQPHDFAHYY